VTATTRDRPPPPGTATRDAAGAVATAASDASGRRHFRPLTTTATNDAIATLALIALTMAGVFSMNRLFMGRSFVGPVLAVAVGCHVVAWFCRRRGWPPIVATLVGVVALVFLVSWAVLPSSTTFGLPLLDTLHTAARSIHQASMDFHQVTAPAPVTQGFVLISACGVGILAILADWAAFRMRATLEATVPSFALFIFCAAIGSRGSRTSSVIVEVSALLAFVVIHQAMVDQESSAWFANRTEGALRSAVSGGAVIGLASLIVALNLGFRLPGATQQGLVSWRAADGSGNGTRSAQSPLVDLQGRLQDPSPTPVFTVTSNQPEYWRQTALDSFNGTEWNALSTYHSVGRQLGQGTTPTVGGQQVVQDFAVATLDSPWLPAAYRPVAVKGIKGITYDPQSGSLLSNNNTLNGVKYQVTSVVSVGTDEVARLESAPPAAPASVAQYLQLPTIDPQVVKLAQKIVQGQTTEYDKALAIENYLRSSIFTYSLTYNYQQPDALYHFLFVARTGYCQQFAGSYAVLARIVGIPTRLAVGWTWGTETSPGVYAVTNQQAHTWPEVYFTGVGWVPFEPTPGRGVPGAQNYTGVPAAEVGQSATNPGTTVTTAPGQVPAGAGHRAIPATTVPKPATLNIHRHHTNWFLQALIWLGGLLAGLALLLGLGIAFRWLQGMAKRDRVVNQAADLESEGTTHPSQDRFARFRKDWSGEGRTALQTVARRLKAIVSLGWLAPILPWRARPAPLAAEVVVRAELLLSWSEVLDLLAWSGVRRRASETYRELAHRAAIELRDPLGHEPEAVHALLQLADAATKAEFGLGSMSPTEAEAAISDLAVVKRALLASATNVQRLRLAVDPRFTVKTR